ncbi:hypothetical protein C8Q76DRAFT_771882 [Earliella scabrosa]|nr:hypothetical protein C8Q76DRAFT_771882 [Earliella scabrosa]
MPECERCDRWFNTERALEQHKDNSSMHHICYPCDRDFPTATGLTQHYIQSPRHAYCRWCDDHFSSFQDLYDHYDDAHWYCNLCDSTFRNELGLHEHRRQSHADRYCVPCKRMFQNANNLRQHQNSSMHQGRTVACPMKGCTRAFPSTAALVLHLESGTCTSGMTRKMVDDLIRKIDRSNIITNPNRMIGGPASSSRSPTVTGEWATERAWNGFAYECYSCHRTYRELAHLNAHLRSPAHAEKIYRCPSAWGGCGADFRTLSAFCQHMENAQCGVHRFKSHFDRYIENIPRSRGLLAY